VHSSGRTPSSVVRSYSGLGADIAYQQCYYRMYQDGWIGPEIDDDIKLPDGTWDFYIAVQGWLPMDGEKDTYAQISYTRVPLECTGTGCGDGSSDWVGNDVVLPEHQKLAHEMCEAFKRICEGG